MSDPRNVAHAKKVTQEKKHHSTDATPDHEASVQPGRKSAAPKKKRDPAGIAAATPSVPAEADVVPGESPSSKQPVVIEGLLAVLARLKEMESHSRANLERLAAMVLTVEDELKQKEMAGPLGGVYSAQNDLQTKLTALIETYQTECDRLQRESA